MKSIIRSSVLVCALIFSGPAFAENEDGNGVLVVLESLEGIKLGSAIFNSRMGGESMEKKYGVERMWEIRNQTKSRGHVYMFFKAPNAEGITKWMKDSGIKVKWIEEVQTIVD